MPTPASSTCQTRVPRTCDVACASDDACSRFRTGQKCIEGRCRAGSEPADAALDGSRSPVSDGRAGSGGDAETAGDTNASGGSGGTALDASTHGGSGGAALDASTSGGSRNGPDGGDGGPSGLCVLDDAWFAMMTEIDVSYGRQTGMWAAGFTGTLRLLTLAHVAPGTHTEAGAALPVDLRVCGMQVPDFTVPDPMVAALGTNPSLAQLSTVEVYGITFPNAVWDDWTTNPSYAMHTTLSAAGLLPGDSVSPGEIALGMGAWSSGPIDLADWPSIYGTDYARLTNGLFDPWEQVDMDQDGHPGITGVAKTGPIPSSSDVYSAQGDSNVVALIDAVTTYSLPLGDTTSDRRRASQIYFGIRAITDATQAVAARVDGCGEITGTTSARTVQHHPVGCLQSTGPNAPQDCPGLTTAFFDSWIPQFTAGAATFTAKRLTNPPAALTSPAACTPARQAFPAAFPP
jgi:hypothetical protein